MNALRASFFLAGLSCAGAPPPAGAPMTPATSSVISPVTWADRVPAVAFSPDGATLVALEGREIVWRRVEPGYPVVTRVPLGADTPLGVTWAGADRVALLVSRTVSFALRTVVRRFQGPTWTEGSVVQLGLVSARTVVGHPTRPLALVPCPTDAVCVLDLETGTLGSTGFVLRSRGEGALVAWDGDKAVTVQASSLVRWDATTGAVVSEVPVTSEVSRILPGVTPILGEARPPRVGTVSVGGPEDLLYDLLGTASGPTVALVLQQDASGVKGLTAHPLPAGSPVPLPWPVAGTALHPSKPLLAWIHGAAGTTGQLRVTDLSTGKTEQPG